MEGQGEGAGVRSKRVCEHPSPHPHPHPDWVQEEVWGEDECMSMGDHDDDGCLYVRVASLASCDDARLRRHGTSARGATGGCWDSEVWVAARSACRFKKSGRARERRSSWFAGPRSLDS